MMHACSNMYFVCISFSLPTTHTKSRYHFSLSFSLIFLSSRLIQRLLMDSGVDHDEQFKKKQLQIIMMDGTPPFSKTTHISGELEDTATMPSPSPSSFHPYPPSPVSQDDGGSTTTNDNRSTACR